MGQNLYLLPVEMDVPHVHLHFRNWFFDLWYVQSNQRFAVIGFGSEAENRLKVSLRPQPS